MVGLQECIGLIRKFTGKIEKIQNNLRKMCEKLILVKQAKIRARHRKKKKKAAATD
jgi:hypothetical protein